MPRAESTEGFGLRAREQPLHALVVGGGIGGLTAAIALRRIGIEADVFERTPTLAAGGSGLVLFPHALRALRSLAIADRVIGGGAPVHLWEGRTWQGKLLGQTSFGRFAEPGQPPAVAIHRADLLKVLAEALDGRHLRHGVRFIGYAIERNQVAAEFEGGHLETGDLLIGADGIRSTVRAQLLQDGPPRYAGYTSWRGIVAFEDASLEPGSGTLVYGRGRTFGVFSLEGARVYWFATCNAPPGEKVGVGGHKSDVRAVVRGAFGLLPSIVEETSEEEILRTDILHRPPVRRWSEGSITLLGDAAHPMTPDAGQGAGQAIGDGPALARALVESLDVPTALHRYEAVRQGPTSYAWRVSRRIGAMGAWENRFACWLRDRLIAAAPGSSKAYDRLFGPGA
jgi:2-polyprenyl-6-methoxyphenol hydroxylase-like FAD-dependent oxidoreductase